MIQKSSPEDLLRSQLTVTPCGGLTDRDSSIGGSDWSEDGPMEENSSPEVIYLPAAVEVVEVESHLLVVMSASDLLQHRPTLEELKIIVMVEMFFLHRHLHGNVSFLLERLELGLCLAVLEDTPMSPLVSLARFVGPLTLIRAGLDCCGSFLKDARSTRASSRRTILFLHISHM